MTRKRDQPKKMQLVKNIWIQGGEYMLTIITELALNLRDTISQYLQKDIFALIILVVYLEVDLSEKI